jgi:hypothetical protein
MATVNCSVPKTVEQAQSHSRIVLLSDLDLPHPQ